VLRLRIGRNITASVFQVEAVKKMLSPDFNIRLIAPKRRNVGNPWFKRGTPGLSGCHCRR
jgi:hypothetical protein